LVWQLTEWCARRDLIWQLEDAREATAAAEKALAEERAQNERQLEAVRGAIALELATVEKESAALREQVQELTDALEQAVAAKARADAEIAALKQKLDELRRELEKALDELAAARDTFSRIEAEVKKGQQRLGSVLGQELTKCPAGDAQEPTARFQAVLAQVRHGSPTHDSRLCRGGDAHAHERGHMSSSTCRVL
jgi:chromosome segregation ATPase